MIGCFSILKWSQSQLGAIQSGGWGLVSTHSCPWFQHFQLSPEFKLHTDYSGVSEQIKLQSSSLTPSSSPCLSSGKHSQRLFQKTITPKGYSKRQSKVLTAKSMTGLLGQLSYTAWTGQTGKYKHCVFPSWLQSCSYQLTWWKEAAAKRGYRSGSTDSVLESKRFQCFVNVWLQQDTSFFRQNEIFDGIGQKLLPTKAVPVLCSIFQSFIGLWVNRNKIACSKLNPVQSIRSKLTTCPRKGRLLRSWSNSTEISDGGMQKLGHNHVWHDFESIATEVCSQIGRK